MTRNNGEVWLVRDPSFGDCGKAKIVDHLSADPRVAAIVRFNGGDNAGHTIVVNGTKIAVHAIPCGVIRNLEHPVLSVIGRGMVINLTRLFAEMTSLRERGISVIPENLLISEGTHLTLTYHMALEKARETSNSRKNTTSRAISQTYALARLYQGVRAGDLRNLDRMSELIDLPLAYVNAILEKVYGLTAVTKDEVMAEILAYREQLLPFLGNEIIVLNRLLKQEKVIICEGAQSGMLDPDLGIYPNTTASNTWPGAIQSGCGLNPRWITRDVIVVKAFTSRVGDGHLVAEIHNETADLIRQKGQEYGTSTGRPRRIGWNDQVVGRFCAMVGPGTELAITKVDVLTGIEPLRICTDYLLNGRLIEIFPTTVDELNHCQPVLEELNGWTKDITGVTSWNELPLNTQAYLMMVAKPFDCPISMVGTGPDRKQIIVL
ncbi:MAG: hypothetical protein A2729_03945 [Candidatus Buchananbacteria bacterium RIFCSPHIGHO2_01_FULL_39_14]|uniref:Adenylosuccinate synthetase n=2 Tax=Candidatus Buchananiibacteriota TaxID=1817903 RepID=A0A1G1YUK8_9BACT|nr:MAG: hypothetical protein A2729_03945 [Candidatus Buchananbacteria bacterium RIFCSPHIGHO2_01_FULL_39_14]OGY56045.1 MAG: hypothetical protein A2912_03520 [Candidatus Buchananbacteria bacterium RIFCSPLOWO2_01_FULL_40_23b]